MTEERPISFNLLLKDELEYEITVRGAQPADGVIAMKAQIRSLNKEIPTDEVVVAGEIDVESELKVIQLKITSLEELMTKSSSKPGSLKSLNRMQSLAHHLFHRLGRLDSDDSDVSSLIVVLQERLNRMLVKLDSVMNHFKSSLSQPPIMAELATDTITNGNNLDKNSFDPKAAVHKLNIHFNGKTCVKAFLQRLEELCLSRGVSESKLFNSAAELFTEEALCWYRGVRGEVHSWSELKTVLLDEYLPSDYDHRLLSEIRSRTQGVDENIINYLSIMQNYFSRLSRQISDEEKLNIVLYNIRPFYTAQLALNPVETWSDLKKKCRLLESARERSRNFTEPPKINSSFLAPDLGCKTRDRSVAAGVAAVQSTNFCVRCRIDGHSLRNCKAPKKIICYRCGENDVTARNCPKCALPSNSSKPDLPKNGKM